MVEGRKEWTDSSIVLGIKDSVDKKIPVYNAKGVKKGLKGIAYAGLSIIGLFGTIYHVFNAGRHAGAAEECENLRKYISDVEETYNNE